MLTYFDAALNGEWMSSLDESVYVLDVHENAAEKVLSHEWDMRSGSRYGGRFRTSLSVTVLFYIIQPDPYLRAEVLQLVQDWARKGGMLEIGGRSGQTLFVKCENPPLMQSASKWTDVLQLTFTAYEFPFWRGMNSANVTITENGSIYPGGACDEMPVDVTVKNIGKTAVTRVRLSVNESVLEFTGISIPADKTLVVQHDQNGVLSAKIGDESILIRRTDESSDDLLAFGGDENSLSVSSDGSVSARFSVWEVWP